MTAPMVHLGATGDSRGSVPGRPTTVVDLELVLENLDGDLAVAAEIVSCLLAALPEDLRELEEAAAAGDASGVSRAAHRLKGAVGTVGARGAGALAQALESRARAGSLEAVSVLLPALEAELRLVRAELACWLEGAAGR